MPRTDLSQHFIHWKLLLLPESSSFEAYVRQQNELTDGWSGNGNHKLGITTTNCYNCEVAQALLVQEQDLTVS